LASRISSSPRGIGHGNSRISWGDVSFTTVSDARSTVIGLKAAGSTQPFSTQIRRKSFSMNTAHILKNSNLPNAFHGKSSNLFKSWTRKGKGRLDRLDRHKKDETASPPTSHSSDPNIKPCTSFRSDCRICELAREQTFICTTKVKVAKTNPMS